MLEIVTPPYALPSADRALTPEVSQTVGQISHFHVLLGETLQWLKIDPKNSRHWNDAQRYKAELLRVDGQLPESLRLFNELETLIKERRQSVLDCIADAVAHPEDGQKRMDAYLDTVTHAEVFGEDPDIVQQYANLRAL